MHVSVCFSVRRTYVSVSAKCVNVLDALQHLSMAMHVEYLLCCAAGSWQRQECSTHGSTKLAPKYPLL